MSDQSYFVAEFQGTYRAPHPDGVRDANVTKQFHVKVKMKRECLNAPGLNGLFDVYYKEFLRQRYPDLIDTYQFNLVEARELDGSVINNPKALSYEGLLAYIHTKRYLINVSLYSPQELRNQVVLYEEDKGGQQFLENKLQAMKGSMLATANELQSLDDVMVVVDEQPSVEALLSGGGKSKAK